MSCTKAALSGESWGLLVTSVKSSIGSATSIVKGHRVRPWVESPCCILCQH